MKLIVAGSRDIADYKLVANRVADVASRYQITEIVSGGARGVDRLAEQWAERYEIPLTRMPADWDKHGKSAGHRRNREMAEYADACLAIWDGKSRGTKSMIQYALEKNLLLFVYTVS